MSDVWLLRLGSGGRHPAVRAMWYIGTRPRNRPGRRVEGRTPRDARMEPPLGAQLERELGDGGQAPGDATVQREMELLDGAVGGTAGATPSANTVAASATSSTRS